MTITGPTLEKRISGSPKSASSAAMVRSHTMASSQPPPRQWPCTEAGGACVVESVPCCAAARRAERHEDRHARTLTRRNDPKIDRARATGPLHVPYFLRRPVAHGVNIGDDARARLELPPQFRSQLQVHVRREKQRDDR